jgi:hypothetical protein
MAISKAIFVLFGAVVLVQTSAVHAQTTISGQVSEPIIVVSPQGLLQDAIGTIITLPNGGVVFGIDITVVCLRENVTATQLGSLLVYPILRQRCLSLDEYLEITPDTDRIDLAFNSLEGTGLDQSPLVLVLPPGESGLQKLSQVIFFDGFE